MRDVPSCFRHCSGAERRLVFRERRGLPRQADREAGTRSFPARHRDGAVMQVDRHFDEIEPDAGADNPRHVAAAMITLEHVLQIVGRNADTTVGKCDFNFVGPAVASISMFRRRRIFDRI